MKFTSGVCRICGCAEIAACPEGCAWVPKTNETLCTACLDRRWRLARHRHGGGVALIDQRSGYRRHYLTPLESRARGGGAHAMKLPGTRIAPGVYDDHGTVHFDVVEYLEGHGIPVNAHNVELVEREFKKQFAAQYPGVPIREVVDR